MPEEITPTPTPTTPAKARANRSEQDQKIANAIAAAGEMINLARNDAAIAPLLAARGYDATKLDEGAALQAAAQAAFNSRQTAIGVQKQATEAQGQAEKKARQTYADFRETARAVYPSRADRAALGLNGKVPKDLQQFITLARASYTAAQGTSYAAKLATYGFPAASATAALAEVDALSGADEAQRQAIGTAGSATKARDGASDALDAWVSQFKRIAKVALRGKPDLAKSLEL